MTVTPIRPHSRATTTTVDFEALTEWELRVIFYAADHHMTYDDDKSPDQGVGRMMRMITAVVGDLGLDLIGEVGELMGYAILTRNYQLQAQLFPDTVRWNKTESAAWVFRKTLAQNPPFLTVRTVTQRWYAVLTSGTTNIPAVA